MNELLIKQIMEDYSCTREDILDHQNHFAIFKINEGRRRYPHIDETFLRGIIINSKFIFSGKKEIIDCLEKELKEEEGQWLLEPENLIKLTNVLDQFNYELSMVHPYYISEKPSIISNNYEVTIYNQEELQKFKDDERFDEAFGSHEEMPDIIAASISMNGEIVGMAGASKDSPYMIQIGINVFEGYEGKGIGTTLVSTLKNKILEMGYLPYYGTSFSHLASQKVALHSGFDVAFVEIFTMPKKSS